MSVSQFPLYYIQIVKERQHFLTTACTIKLLLISIQTRDVRPLLDTDYLETWRGMVEAKRLGLAKSIGVCNFNLEQMERLWNSSDVKPAVLQIEVCCGLLHVERVPTPHGGMGLERACLLK